MGGAKSCRKSKWNKDYKGAVDFTYKEVVSNLSWSSFTGVGGIQKPHCSVLGAQESVNWN